MAADVGAKAPDFTSDERESRAGDAQRGVGRRARWSSRSCLRRSAAPAPPKCAPFRDKASDLLGSANVLGITVDTFFALGAWKKAENLSETLPSDFNKDVTRATAC